MGASEDTERLKELICAARSNRGRACRLLGRYEESLEDWEWVCLERPGDPELLKERGVTRWFTGRLQAAIDDFREAASGFQKRVQELSSGPSTNNQQMAIACALDALRSLHTWTWAQVIVRFHALRVVFGDLQQLGRGEIIATKGYQAACPFVHANARRTFKCSACCVEVRRHAVKALNLPPRPLRSTRSETPGRGLRSSFAPKMLIQRFWSTMLRLGASLVPDQA